MASRTSLPSNSVPQALGRLRVALQDSYDHASRALDLSPQQAELLCAAMRPASVGELAKLLRCDRSNVSRLVDRASGRGLVERRSGDEDGRVSMIELTPEGHQLAERFVQLLTDQLGPLLATWSMARQRSLVELVSEIADSLDTHNGSKAPPPTH
jgi:DNA-binding MarR family transcriptional regulator